MRIAIRLIGIATSFFWIFLIIFSVSAMYSMKDMGFEFGEPRVSLAEGNQVVFSLPITVTNRGLYNLADFNISTLVTDENGSSLARASTFIPTIRRGESVNTTHDININITDLLSTHQSFLFDDAELQARETIGVRAAELIPVQASANVSLPWGAPLYNFTLGAPTFTSYNATHLRAVVPVSFVNHAPFDIVGAAHVDMYDGGGSLAGESELGILAFQDSPFSGSLELVVPLEMSAASGRFEVFFITPFFESEPLVIPYG